MNQDLDLECKLRNMGEEKRRELKLQIDEHFQTIKLMKSSELLINKHRKAS